MPEKKAPTTDLAQQMLGPPPAQMKEFDFIIGNWDVSINYFRPDGTVDSEEKARWNAEYRNNGRMILDEFNRLSPDGVETSCAITLRTFCLDTNQWESTFLFSQQQTIPETFTGKFVDGEGHFEVVVKHTPEFTFMARIFFFDIQEDSFMWKIDNSTNGGKTWVHRQTNSVRRIS